MTRYTASHWGLYEVEQDKDGPRLAPFRDDPDPSPIGLHQLDPSLDRSRVARPAVRRSFLEGGPGTRTDLRGSEDFVEVDWDTALDLAASAIRGVKDKHGNASIFAGSYGWSSAGRFHHAQSQIHRFYNSIGGYVRHMDSYSLGAGRVLLPHIVGTMDFVQANHTSWDVLEEHCELFIAFGGVPAKNAQVNSGMAARHLVPGGLRRMAEAGTRFVNVGPVSDNLDTGHAVDWIPIRPNTDTAMMLAMAWVLETEGLTDPAFLDSHCTGYPTFRRYLLGEADGQPKTPDWAEPITGVPADRIAALAREAAAKRTMINGSWSLQRATHGEQPFWMVITLAAMLGQIGTPGGGFGLGYGPANLMGSNNPRLPGPTLSQGQNAVPDFIPVARIADMLLNPGAAFTYNGMTRAYPDIRLVHWAGGNPYHHHQDLNRLREAWQKPETIIVNEQFWTATAKHADIVFPATTTMEREDIGYAAREANMVAMDRIRDPFAEARDDYDIFTALAQRLGAEETYTEGLTARGWLERMYEEFRAKVAMQDIDVPSFADFWDQGLIDFTPLARPVIMMEDFVRDPAAHPLTTPSGRIEITSAAIAGFALADCPGHPTWMEPREWLGQTARESGTMHLISDQPMRRLHSQLDPSPWSRDGKVNGREPVVMNPADAAARGIADGDIVEVWNGRGRCLAGAVLSDAVMEGVVRLSTGAWYDPDPETGRDRHGNPNTLTLDLPASGLSQGCAAQTCLVHLSGPVNDAPAIRAFDPPAFFAAE
ncbi:molybdopterin-dependent oxidoreductase [Chachezhania sediminis]|uniref:molybdopterin-dependent oxidoreductase n=1 Tax=Chachezhania sediminis TaxID=2599291 RepID=UPI00131BC246|nr:molybdopterin-dependent oxidoreductase [Chachezhania sediminis]